MLKLLSARPWGSASKKLITAALAEVLEDGFKERWMNNDRWLKVIAGATTGDHLTDEDLLRRLEDSYQVNKPQERYLSNDDIIMYAAIY